MDRRAEGHSGGEAAGAFTATREGADRQGSGRVLQGRGGGARECAEGERDGGEATGQAPVLIASAAVHKDEKGRGPARQTASDGRLADPIDIGNAEPEPTQPRCSKSTPPHWFSIAPASDLSQMIRPNRLPICSSRRKLHPSIIDSPCPRHLSRRRLSRRQRSMNRYGPSCSARTRLELHAASLAAEQHLAATPRGEAGRSSVACRTIVARCARRIATSPPPCGKVTKSRPPPSGWSTTSTWWTSSCARSATIFPLATTGNDCRNSPTVRWSVTRAIYGLAWEFVRAHR